MHDVRLKGEGRDPYSALGVRGDAHMAAMDFLHRVVCPKIDIVNDEIVLGYSAVYALGHLIAALPERAIANLLDQSEAARAAENREEQPKPWQPPTPALAGRS